MRHYTESRKLIVVNIYKFKVPFRVPTQGLQHIYCRFLPALSNALYQPDVTANKAVITLIIIALNDTKGKITSTLKAMCVLCAVKP